MNSALLRVGRILMVSGILSLLLTFPARSDESRSAREFIQKIYEGYTDNDAPPDTLGALAENIFARELLRLIREDQQLANGEIGLLDHDPICACQDTANLKVRRIDIVALDHQRKQASVLLVNGGKPVRVKLILVREGGGWRILDIKEPGISSVKRFLASGIARLRSSKH